MGAWGYSVALGTAVSTVVEMSSDSQSLVLQNLQPESDVDEYARNGDLYVIGQKFTLVGSGTAIFNMATGPTGVQLEGYEIVSSAEAVFAELIEGATVTTTGAAIPSYNLNRNVADAAQTVFQAATVATGGSAISSELVTGSKQGGGAGVTFTKIHTLRADEDYAMRFVNQTNQDTVVFLQLIFSEKFNGQNDIWLGGSIGDGYRLRGGESVHLELFQGETLEAVAEESASLGVFKQD